MNRDVYVAAAAVFLMATPARSDIVHLNTGQQIKGKVVEYANMSFEVTGPGGASTKYPAMAVRRIEFDGELRPSQIETRTKGAIEGTVVRFDNSVFTLKNAGGANEQLPAMLVTRVSFGGPVVPAMLTITRGGRVDLSKHLVRGKVTIVDFYADWCGPCRLIAPHLEKIAREDPDVVLRKIDIINWASEVAKQYNINSIPRIEIYDRAGKLVGTVRSGRGEKQVQEFVSKAKATTATGSL
jgi:thioredoxin 1